MKNLINQLGFGDSFALRTVAAVKELMNHDMIYVYHHLKLGAMVELKRRGENIYGDPEYDVYYEKFKLGSCTITGIMKSFYLNESTVYAEIVGLSKEKYMPISALDIQLGVETLKKVS